MIPYFEQPKLSLGPFTIHAFGALVAIGVIVGAEVLRRRAGRQGLDTAFAQRLVTWVLVGGFVGAHLVDRFIYFPKQTLADPLSILMIWKGISSFGGFLGGTLGAVMFLRRHGMPDRPTFWRYLDLVAYALPIGWIFGRTGCFVAFDHPGLPTNFFLGMADEHGQVIWNLGLVEAIYTVFLVGALLVLDRKPRPPGFFVGALCIIYAPFRFAADFLRVRDVRYFELTPGQYGSLAALGLGIWIVVRAYQMKAAPGANERRASATPA